MSKKLLTEPWVYEFHGKLTDIDFRAHKKNYWRWTAKCVGVWLDRVHLSVLVGVAGVSDCE